MSATTVFGTPVDVTLAEVALACFFPADAATGDHLRAIADAITGSLGNSGAISPV